MKLKTIALAAVIAAGVVSVSSANAAIQTLTGDTIVVTFDDAQVGLFGTPTLVNDMLFWFPTSFAATVAGNSVIGGTGLITTQLSISAKAGYNLAAFGAFESGTYYHFGLAESGVSVSGSLRVTPLPGTTQTSNFGATGFAANAFGDTAANNWSVASGVIFAGAGTTQANVGLTNSLLAYSAGFGAASIGKTEVGLAIVTTPVPEPETYAMMLAGLAALGFLARRRQA